MTTAQSVKPDGDLPFGSSAADWAMPGVQRPLITPEPAELATRSVPVARALSRLMLPEGDAFPVTPEGEPAPAVVAGLALIQKGVALLQAGSLAGFTPEHKRAVMEQVARVRSQVDAGYLQVVQEFDADPETVPSVSRHVAATFLKQRLRYGPAQSSSDVQAATAVSGPDPALPLMGAALAAGQITRAHVDVAVRCLNHIPRHLLHQVDEAGVRAAAKVDAYLVEHSRTFAPTTTAVLARQILAMLDPDGDDRYDPKAYERRFFSCRTDNSGMVYGRFQFAPAEGAIVRAAIETAVKATRDQVQGQTDDGQQVLFSDERSLGQRFSDAVTTIMTTYLRGETLSTMGTPPASGATGPTGATGEAEGSRCRCATAQIAAPVTRVIVVATPEQVAAARAAIPLPRDENGRRIIPPRTIPPPGATASPPRATAPPPRATASPPKATAPPPRAAPPPPPLAGLATEVTTGPLDPGAFGRLLCDAVEQVALVDRNHKILYLGRTTRLATGPQRTALIARDRGCVVPGCAVPPSGCEAHHVIWWRHGGRTDIDNLALLCSRHHTLVHTGEWELAIRDGIPWVTPPAWVDPQRRPLRNTVPTAEHTARQLGQSLRIGQQVPLDLPEPSEDH